MINAFSLRSNEKEVAAVEDNLFIESRFEVSEMRAGKLIKKSIEAKRVGQLMNKDRHGVGFSDWHRCRAFKRIRIEPKFITEISWIQIYFDIRRGPVWINARPNFRGSSLLEYVERSMRVHESGG